MRIGSLEGKTEAVLVYAEDGSSFHEVERIFCKRFADNPICRKYLRGFVEKCQRTGSVPRAKGAERKFISEGK